MKINSTAIVFFFLLLPLHSFANGNHHEYYTNYKGSITCNECHIDKAKEILNSVHYQWKGATPDVTNLNGPSGKIHGMNDFCTFPEINWKYLVRNEFGNIISSGCSACHVGLGKKPNGKVTKAQLNNIDCLVCHSEVYKRKLEKNQKGQLLWVPDTIASGDLTEIIRVTNKGCLNCHSKAGGGPNNKRGDIDPNHDNLPKTFDVHLAKDGEGLMCIDCHTVKSHQFAGRGSDLRPTEPVDMKTCEDCHGERPHEERKIDKHVERVACETCHVPTFAKVTPTEMYRDFSSRGEPSSNGLYEPSGVKDSNIIPEYTWNDGTSHIYSFGDQIELDEYGSQVMSEPNGSINTAGSKIYPFKIHDSTLAYSIFDNVIVPMKLRIVQKTGNMNRALIVGGRQSGLSVDGMSDMNFIPGIRYMGIHHEVMPDDYALKCNECHEGGTRLDFADLGYTPVEKRNGIKLCISCHTEEEKKPFFDLHNKHAKDKNIACNECHIFDR